MLEATAQPAETETVVAPDNSVKLAMKVQIGEAGSFEGMASVLGSIAHGAKGPVTFKQGAFRETLAEKAGVFPLLWQHADDQPIGKIVLSETSEGLAARGFITQNTRGQEITALLRDGVPLGLSIGFNPVQAAYEKHADGSLVRCVSKANVKETSIVTFPADQAAQIRVVHSAVGTMVAKSVTENDRAWVEGAITEILGDDIPQEIHAGRVFSASNLSRMKTVAESLLELIALAEPDYPAALLTKFSTPDVAPAESVTGPAEIAEAHSRKAKRLAFERGLAIDLLEAESFLTHGAPAGHEFYGNQHQGGGGGDAGSKDAGANDKQITGSQRSETRRLAARNPGAYDDPDSAIKRGEDGKEYVEDPNGDKFEVYDSPEHKADADADAVAAKDPDYVKAKQAQREADKAWYAAARKYGAMAPETKAAMAKANEGHKPTKDAWNKAKAKAVADSKATAPEK